MDCGLIFCYNPDSLLTKAFFRLENIQGGGGNMKNIVIIEDHPLVIEAIKQLFSKDETFRLSARPIRVKMLLIWCDN